MRFALRDYHSLDPVTERLPTVSGPATFTGLIAAVNDPFFPSGDPVTPVPRLAFVELAPVPAPSSTVLLGSALLLATAVSNRAAADYI